MGVSWTKEQQQVIDLRKRNILVSAAAGSGKTAVLVERIIKMITEKEHPVDIDRLLIVTFTKAAAAEMRERIGNAIEKEIEEHPGEEHLLKQLTLIHNAQITTIDSFCLYVIRNHFHEIDLEPNFRIGDEGELKLLKADVLKKVMEHNYEEMRPDFSAFAKSYVSGKSDTMLHDMILTLFEFSRSYPWPKEWLSSCIKDYEIDSVKELDEAHWMKPLVENIRCVVKDLEGIMQRALSLALDGDGPDMYEKVIRSDLEKYRQIALCQSFTEFYKTFHDLSYDRLPSSRGFDGDMKKLELVKALRDQAKDVVKKIKHQYFFIAPKVMAEQLKRTGFMAEQLVRLTEEFAAAFSAEKKRKNLVDFHDLEHFALEILVDEETKRVRKTAEEFRDSFEEIMIDEYQDSNYVQETILRAISKEERGENNIFMVGDVKQSIYRFRLARPELFMEKYDTYTLDESETQRIDLHKNFRSRDEVLSCVNDIFHKIMTKDLGNVAYDSDAALHIGASYPEGEEIGMFAPEILIADSSDVLFEESDYADYNDKKLLEAKMISAKIRSLMESQLVTDKESGELRRVKYSDIVILLRSLSGWAERIASVLGDDGIPVHTVSSTGYFSAVEVQTVLAMLQILDNPRQDIPLTAVLRSPIVGMTDEELAILRLKNREVAFHTCVLEQCREFSRMEEIPEADRKLYDFYQLYQSLRRLVPDTPIHELIEVLLRDTGYGNYAAAMPAGKKRRANLQMLVEKAIAYENTSYKGLFHFVRYIEQLQKYDIDFGEADTVSENEDVVRIMSIHKSKGLEFPVVIVSGLGKNFNRQDTRSRMVLHPELGLGLDFMDGERRLKAATIAKRAIAKQIDLENLGEELRILYVAVTRAKEKLILTGSKKDAIKEQETYHGKYMSEQEGALSYIEREGAAGYLDWIWSALVSYKEKYKIRVIGAEELVIEEIKKQISYTKEKESCLEKIYHADQALIGEIDDRFSFQYPYLFDMQRKNKYSVSELKNRAMREQMELEEEELTLVFSEEEFVSYVPALAKKMEQHSEEVNQGAIRGTVMHRVMECCQFASGISAEEQLVQMLADGKITQQMLELVKVQQMQSFMDSDTGERMKRAEAAGRLYREQPFVMGFTEEDLIRFGFGEMQQVAGSHGNFGEDLTLIQGIIDVFWLEEDGIVLLDYKTDRIHTGKQLAERYGAQLMLYGEALERIFSKTADRDVRVKERLLYSFFLGQVISV